MIFHLAKANSFLLSWYVFKINKSWEFITMLIINKILNQNIGNRCLGIKVVDRLSQRIHLQIWKLAEYLAIRAIIILQISVRALVAYSAPQVIIVEAYLVRSPPMEFSIILLLLVEYLANQNSCLGIVVNPLKA